MPKITYSGQQAAFSFDGIQIGKDQTIDVTTAILGKLQKGKVFKALLESGDLSVDDTQDSKPAGRGKGGKQDGAATDATKAAEDSALATVQAELTELGITFADDETIEQLQAKLAQAKE
ncbi:hypothetical protein [Acinetobacter wuhouensis]|uniref:Uncharacterized protein n=1 Tax=Acinetobacter wuhouensis TaxID=1879050 RepID=A0A4Q7AIJ0_9GAMM|nr:hypothetical protein [Acinetobacter wuhouensis]RZG48070.1 hypothetical protein EXU28_04695 [Acinetobacter wuhouensis]